MRGIGNRRARERDERAGPTIPDSDATRVRERQQINGEREMRECAKFRRQLPAKVVSEKMRPERP